MMIFKIIHSSLCKTKKNCVFFKGRTRSTPRHVAPIPISMKVSHAILSARRSNGMPQKMLASQQPTRLGFQLHPTTQIAMLIYRPRWPAAIWEFSDNWWISANIRHSNMVNLTFNPSIQSWWCTNAKSKANQTQIFSSLHWIWKLHSNPSI